MLFDLTPHKLRVAAEMAITAAVGGAIAAVMAAWVDPTQFDPTKLDAWRNLGRVALGGAFTGVLFLLRSLPRNPAAYQRREDVPQVVKAAKDLVQQGEIPPILPKSKV